ncbi:hypothetical protein DNU06_04340 [Putridiphycobacter roseus]|uniref:DUF4184 domain-containing protein n=1 Tax=Putridiphycobacter roseus TaxID=2219161 RepID=A0A2W1N221_9FLAO|nr:DUF4184 family protein [Putridiphycobacter roseus]PZE17854.1 hypothetical protein DNU06_04340 [Putridiphycobacter roseus]
MPFTFSHPAIILPLCHKRFSNLSSTGMIIGSITPDLEYFLRMRMERIHGHEVGAIFWYQLPICFIFSVIFHVIVKKPLLLHSPTFIQKRLGYLAHKNWIDYLSKHWTQFIVSAIIGILSHLIWDSFTHAHGLFGKSSALLMLSFEYTWGRTYLFEWFQLLSSLLGLLALFLFIFRRQTKPYLTASIHQKWKYWFSTLLIIAFIVYLHPIPDFATFIATFIMASILGVLGSAIYQKIYEKIYLKRTKKF